uniref:Uncharacterized protein n=1 Tax=Panagrolaimus sp. ES5 TaxID=591445 RepID=A0AC34FSJ2_9BILA
MFEFLNPLDNKTDKSYFAFIQGIKSIIHFYVVGANTEELIPSQSFRTKDGKEFISALPKILNYNFKAVIIDIFQNPATEFSNNNLNFCRLIRAILQRQQIPYYFVTNESSMYSSNLVAANINQPKIDDSILIVLVGEDNIISNANLTYTSNGYIITNSETFEIDPKESNEKIRENIVGSSTPKKIILSIAASGNPIVKSLAKLLKSKKLIHLEYKMLKLISKYLVETCQWLLAGADKTTNLKYHIIFIADGIPDEDFAKKKAALPNAHRYILSLTVDEEHFPSYSIEPTMAPKIEELPKMFDKIVSSKIPVITFFDNLSVVCINKNDKYEFFNSWNGVLGQEVMISFHKEKPIFGDKAVEAQRTKPSFSAYDLINIMSMEADKIVRGNQWLFTIIKDAENPVLLEFDNAENVNGEKSAASPAFLMALILKEIRKLIKVEVGKKPKELAFWIFNDGNKYNEEEIKRIELQLTESCHLIKTSCNFVKF